MERRCGACKGTGKNYTFGKCLMCNGKGWLKVVIEK